MDHREPIQPEHAVELGQDTVDLARIADVVAGAPQVSRVQAEGDSPIEPSGGRGLEHCGQLLEADPDAVAATGRVLDDDERCVGAVGRLGEGPRQAVDQPGHARIHSGAAM